jgi:hypothetical protein
LYGGAGLAGVRQQLDALAGRTKRVLAGEILPLPVSLLATWGVLLIQRVCYNPKQSC